MIRILSFFDYFYPAVKSGGPSKSSLGFAQNLSAVFRIKVVTRDRDKRDQISFPSVVVDDWNAVERFSVFYASRKGIRRFYLSELKSEDFDIYYFNSIFSVWYSIVPMLLIRFRILPLKKIVIAPRGELAEGALCHNFLVKKIYLSALKQFILTDGVRFHATAMHEVLDVKNKIGSAVEVSLIPNLRPKALTRMFSCVQKAAKSLRVIFLSRITPVKNLDFAIQVMADANPDIVFDIFGFIDDQDYFEKCQSLIARSNLKNVSYKGAVLSEDVEDLLQKYHLLFLPTQGENFGHVILEAFGVSRPVLISDKTPWRGLIGSKAGADLCLNRQVDFVSWLNTFYDMSPDQFDKFCLGSYSLAEKYYASDKVSEYKKLFSIKVN